MEYDKKVYRTNMIIYDNSLLLLYFFNCKIFTIIIMSTDNTLLNQLLTGDFNVG